MRLKQFAPYLAALALFLIITVIQFGPLFKGKVINQSDIVQYRGMSHELHEARKTGDAEALWTNSMFGGMPAYQVSPINPGNWMNFVDRLVHLFLPHPSGYIFMGFAGFFILLLCLGINPWLALVGSLAYGFSSYFFIILEVGHNSKSNAIGYLAPVLGGIVLLMRGKYRLGFALCLLFMALELNANHVQITYYGFIIFGLVLLTYLIQAIKQKTLKPYFIGVALFAAASAIAILPNAGNLLTTYEYGHYTTRGPSELTIDATLKSNKGNATSGLDKDYAAQYSYGIGESFTLLIPDFKGGLSAPIGYMNKEALKKVNPELREQLQHESAYFGPQSLTAGPVYIGAIVIFLAFLGLLIIDSPLKWPLFIATILSLLLAWGKYLMGFTSFAMDYLPGYNKFRAVSMTLVIAEFTIPLLAVMAIDQFIKSPTAMVKLPFGNYDVKKMLIVAAAIVGGFCLLGYGAPSLVNTFTMPGEEADIARKFEQGGATAAQAQALLPEYMDNLILARQTIFKSDALRSFLFIALAGVCLFLYLNKKIKAGIVLTVMGVLFAADLWPVAGRYLNDRSFIPKAQYEAPPQKSEADERILMDTALDYRVLNLTGNPFQDAVTSYYHKSIGGYHGAKLKKYDELISFHLMRESRDFYSDLVETHGNDSLIKIATAKMNVLNMLNTKYMILPTGETTFAFKNDAANGNAWFIKDLETVTSADSEMVALRRTPTKTKALIQQKNKPAGVAGHYDGEGSIRLTAYAPSHLVYATNAAQKEFAVFSEIYYPKGWNAYVDGNLASYTCVDYLLRGMEVPAGQHRVEFKFEPGIYKTGKAISMAGSVMVLLLVGAGFYLAFKKDEWRLPN